MSELLSKAQTYQEQRQKEISLEQRPGFHVSSPVGWINDPNGWSLYQGEYHLFFQYHPYNTQWGPMHWGHMKTKDFLTWETLPVALAPDESYDRDGCFSGSGLEKSGQHILMYTGVMGEKQVQCIAIGDGVHYKKIANNPVITGEMLPKGCNQFDFRDPKIWEKDGSYYAVIGSKNQENDGQVVLFESKDLKQWNYVCQVGKSNHEYGAMWECPDLFQLDGYDVLLTSPQFMKAKGLEFHNGNTTLCIMGTLGENGKLIEESKQAIDYGLDFYAPQTLLTADGRRIMIGWMQSWDNYLTPEHFQWSGMMSIPRELKVKEGRLFQNPVRELLDRRKNPVQRDVVVDKENPVKGCIKGRQFDLQIKVNKVQGQELEIRLACGADCYTSIFYQPDQKMITFDRTYSGFYKDFVCVRKMKIDDFKEGMDLRILMDKYTIELFVNDGKYAMSSLIYTELSYQDIQFHADGKVELEINKYDII